MSEFASSPSVRGETPPERRAATAPAINPADFWISPERSEEVQLSIDDFFSRLTINGKHAGKPLPKESQIAPDLQPGIPVTLDVDDAIAQVEANANSQWKEAALRILKDICERHREFTTDLLAEELGKTMHHTQDLRAVGSIMRKAMKNGWCLRSTTFTKSNRKHCHSMDIPVYQSLLFPQPHEHA
jgi:hypothetical protein